MNTPFSMEHIPTPSALQACARRQFFSKSAFGLGAVALATMLGDDARVLGQQGVSQSVGVPGILEALHHVPKAKRVIYLFQSGGPSQLDLFDYKPMLQEQHGKPLPDSIRNGQRLTGMSGNQAILPLAQSIFKFEQHGSSGAWISELLPYTAKIADKLCIVKSMYTQAINHDPAITFLQTGSEMAGRPSIGAWMSYGLGTENENLPAFVVLVTKDKRGQPLYQRLWGSGFLPSRYQGVQLRAGSEPVLYLNDPDGVSRDQRRSMLDLTKDIDLYQQSQNLDPAIDERIAQYEMAFRLQSSIPEVNQLADEPQHVLDLYGPDVKKPGSFAANCLLARRLVERGVRFVQLFHQDWDHHGGLPGGLRNECKQTDQPSAGLVADLAQRGLLDDTLVVWGGEFGRTNYCQGKLTATDYGRDHHPRCFSMWMAGGGTKPGLVYGQTDEFGYNVVDKPVHVHDLHATILHLLGVDHERLTYKFQGRRFRLTDVHGIVQNELIDS
jgi:uncharacterized protein (DUF1501 family)